MRAGGVAQVFRVAPAGTLGIDFPPDWRQKRQMPMTMASDDNETPAPLKQMVLFAVIMAVVFISLAVFLQTKFG